MLLSRGQCLNGMDIFEPEYPKYIVIDMLITAGFADMLLFDPQRLKELFTARYHGVVFHGKEFFLSKRKDY